MLLKRSPQLIAPVLQWGGGLQCAWGSDHLGLESKFENWEPNSIPLTHTLMPQSNWNEHIIKLVLCLSKSIRSTQLCVCVCESERRFALRLFFRVRLILCFTSIHIFLCSLYLILNVCKRFSCTWQRNNNGKLWNSLWNKGDTNILACLQKMQGFLIWLSK